MWVVAKLKDDGAALIYPEEDIASITQMPGDTDAVILMRREAPQKNQCVTEISVHRDLGSAVRAMVNICHPEIA